MSDSKGTTQRLLFEEPATQQGEAASARESYYRAYYAANREAILAGHRERRKRNLEQTNAQERQRYQANKEAILARQRAYYAANREKILARERASHAANKEEAAAKRRAARQANPERYRQKDRERQKSEAYRARRAKYMKAYSKKNRNVIAAKQAAHREANREAIREQQRVYYVQHRETLLERQRLIREADPEKARANHRRKHRRRKAIVIQIKVDRGCERCGLRDARCLQFHHRDPKAKRFNIATRALRRWKDLEAEIAKCAVLCANCHSCLHADERSA